MKSRRSKGKEDTRLEVKDKAQKPSFYRDGEKKVSGAGCFISSVSVSPSVDIRNWKGIPDQAISIFFLYKFLEKQTPDKRVVTLPSENSKQRLKQIWGIKYIVHACVLENKI